MNRKRLCWMRCNHQIFNTWSSNALFRISCLCRYSINMWQTLLSHVFFIVTLIWAVESTSFAVTAEIACCVTLRLNYLTRAPLLLRRKQHDWYWEHRHKSTNTYNYSRRNFILYLLACNAKLKRETNSLLYLNLSNEYCGTPKRKHEKGKMSFYSSTFRVVIWAAISYLSFMVFHPCLCEVCFYLRFETKPKTSKNIRN